MKKNQLTYNSFYVMTIVVFIFSALSCGKNINNDKKYKDLENEFLLNIEQDNAKYFVYQQDKLVPQKSYFVDGKLKYLTFRHEPEIGYVEGTIIFDLATNSIEKYSLREILPRLKYQKGASTFDTIFVFYPKLHVTETYFDNKLINSTNRQDKINEQIKFIFELKEGTQKKYNSS